MKEKQKKAAAKPTKAVKEQAAKEVKEAANEATETIEGAGAGVTGQETKGDKDLKDLKELKGEEVTGQETESAQVETEGTKTETESAEVVTAPKEIVAPKVSVVMIVGNHDLANLQLAIASIIDQEFTDFELVIINQGEDEAIAEFLGLLNDNAVLKDKVVNIGFAGKSRAEALNSALGLSSGEYVALMNPEDVAMLNWLKDQYAYAKAKEAVVCGCQIRFMSDGRITKHAEKQNAKEVLAKAGYWITNNPGVFMLREKILELGAYPATEDLLPEDYHLWLRVLAEGHTIYTNPATLMVYRYLPVKQDQVKVNKFLAEGKEALKKYTAVK